MKNILNFFIVITMTLACQNSKSSSLPATLNGKGARLSWVLNNEIKKLEIVLVNTSNHAISIRAAKKYFEASIVVTGQTRLKYYESNFQNLRLTSSWLTEITNLAPKESITWSLNFDAIVPEVYKGISFSSAIKNGTVSIEKFRGFEQ